MDEMKSALDRALERAEKLGTLSPDEMKRLESMPRGNLLAAHFLREDGFDLESELTRLKGSGTRKYVIEGIQEILLHNIALPRDPKTKQATKRAMAGLQIVKENKKALSTIFARLEQLFNYYEQARQQGFSQLKQNFETHLNQRMGGLEKQILGGKPKPRIENLPEFQDEWFRVQANLDQQYEKAMAEQRHEIMGLN